MSEDLETLEENGAEAAERALIPAKQSRRRQSAAPSSSRGTVDAETTRGAGAAGVGGGTLIAVLASSLSDGLTKTVLIWLAPAATVTFTAVWIWGRRKVIL